MDSTTVVDYPLAVIKCENSFVLLLIQRNN